MRADAVKLGLVAKLYVKGFGCDKSRIGVSSRQGWKSGRVKVPVPSIACIRTVIISGVCEGHKAGVIVTLSAEGLRLEET
jgi:hypothetical protein